MYADYIFPDLAYLERWSNLIGTSPVVLTKISKFRQPVATPIPETVTVGGEQMPSSMDAVMLAVAEHLGPAVFDEAKWQNAVGKLWGSVVTLLNRGGRFESADHAYKGNFVAHSWGKLVDLYSEPVGTTKHAITAQRFSGVPIYRALESIDGRPVTFPAEYPLHLFT